MSRPSRDCRAAHAERSDENLLPLGGFGQVMPSCLEQGLDVDVAHRCAVAHDRGAVVAVFGADVRDMAKGVALADGVVFAVGASLRAERIASGEPHSPSAA